MQSILRHSFDVYPFFFFLLLASKVKQEGEIKLRRKPLGATEGQIKIRGGEKKGRRVSEKERMRQRGTESQIKRIKLLIRP